MKIYPPKILRSCLSRASDADVFRVAGVEKAEQPGPSHDWLLALIG